MDIIKKQFKSLKSTSEKVIRTSKIPQASSQLKHHSQKYLTRVKGVIPYQISLPILGIVLLGILTLGGGWWYQQATQPIPVAGGTLREGVVGQPQFINPLFATPERTSNIAQIDKTLEQLVYPRLFTISPQGELIPSIVKEYTVVDAGKNYSFTLRDDIIWDDGTSLTTQDIAFTIERIQDEKIGSQLQASLRDVSITVENDFQFSLTLKNTYTPFLYNLSFGILPQHIWENYTSEEFITAPENLKPIGAGSFRVAEVITESDSFIRSLILEKNLLNPINQPNIERILFTFYNSEDSLIDAFNRQEVTAFMTNKSLEERLSTDLSLVKHTMNVPQYFAILFNMQDTLIQNSPELRKALNAAINRSDIIESELNGLATPVFGALTPFNRFTVPGSDPYSVEQSQQYLQDAGWTKNIAGIFEKDGTTASITITAADGLPISGVMESIQSYAREVGIEVNVTIINFKELAQTQIPSRDFQALFVGTALNIYPDPYIYWHSSQATTPGFNVSQYSNANVDEKLELARTSSDTTLVEDNLLKFQEVMNTDVPAVFLYSPSLVYYTQDPVSNVTLSIGTTSADRYSSIADWYARVGRQRK